MEVQHGSEGMNPPPAPSWYTVPPKVGPSRLPKRGPITNGDIKNSVARSAEPRWACPVPEGALRTKTYTEPWKEVFYFHGRKYGYFHESFHLIQFTSFRIYVLRNLFFTFMKVKLYFHERKLKKKHFHGEVKLYFHGGSTWKKTHNVVNPKVVTIAKRKKEKPYGCKWK